MVVYLSGQMQQNDKQKQNNFDDHHQISLSLKEITDNFVIQITPQYQMYTK